MSKKNREKMDDDVIQAYVWQDVIRLGFSPSGSKDKNNWLRMYGRSLKDFWEIDEPPLPPKGKETIIAELICTTSMDISLSYTITNIKKFAVTFSPVLDRSNMWVHDVDGSYYAFPERSLLSKYKKAKEAMNEMSTKHIQNVLDGLIFHPRAHQHIKTDFHSIRIGGGIYNPFLYLFHLRYQLCPDETRRSEEKTRLISLFESAVNSNTPVTANKLLLSN